MRDLIEHLVQTNVSDDLAELVELSNLNSSSDNLGGLERTLSRCMAVFEGFGARATVEPLPPRVQVTDRGAIDDTQLGNVGRLRQRPNASIQLLLVGHYDTVFSADHHFQEAVMANDVLVGPGVADMKGGLLVMRNALRTLEASPWASDIGWELLLTPDEEIGSPGSSTLFRDASDGKTAGLIFEPSFPDGHLASTRKGSGTFDIHVAGRAAHAGRDHHLGRNAIVHAARIAAAVDDLNGQWEGVTINISAISGGSPTNIVPDNAVVRLNVRIPTVASAQVVETAIAACADSIAIEEGIVVSTHGSFSRMPKELTADITHLLNGARSAAHAIGVDLDWRGTGGVSDGNNLADLGLPNLDNLGVQGGNIHSDNEYMIPESLGTRSDLAGLLMLMLGSRQLEMAT